MIRTLLTAACLGTAATAFAQNVPSPVPPTPEQRAEPVQRKLLPNDVVLLNGGLAPAGAPKAGLDEYIRKNMQDWNIPGLAIAIVKDGRTVYMKGFGTRTVGKAEPVDSNTLFFIASNSKLFTGTVVSHLVDQKRMSLDDKITKYFPDYRLYDSTSTRMVTVRDMLAHRIGTKTFQGDFTFLDSKLTREEIMYRMRFLKPSAVFRQDYGYCNSCYLTAGMVAEKVSGRSWEAYVTDTILKPLGMARTTALSNDAPRRDNIARPYTNLYTGQLSEQPYDQWDNLGPAASILSSVADMTHWLKMQLDSGRYQGRRILPWSTLLRTRDVQIMQSSRKNPRFPTHFRGYGLGVGVSDYNGRQVYAHTGGAVGMLSAVCFVPEERLGIVILTNQDNQAFFELLRYHLLDEYLGVRPAPDRISQALTATREADKAMLDSVALWRSQVKRSAMLRMLPPAPPAGTYRNAVYGTVTVAKAAKGGGIEISFTHHPFLKAKLAWMGRDRWLTEYNVIEYGIFPATVGTSASGKPTITLQVNDFVEMDPYVFELETPATDK